LPNRHRARLERKFRFGIGRERKLRALDGLVQLETEFAFDEPDEGRQTFRRGCRPLDPLQHLERRPRLQEREVVPPLEPLIRPDGNRQEFLRRARYSPPMPRRGATRLRMMRLSKVSPASGTPSVPMMSDARRPRSRMPGPTEMIVKSLVPPPKSPMRIRSSCSSRAS